MIQVFDLLRVWWSATLLKWSIDALPPVDETSVAKFLMGQAAASLEANYGLDDA